MNKANPSRRSHPHPPHPQPEPPPAPIHNRIAAILTHIPWYAFEGQARLARDVGVSRSTISRLLAGLSSPSFVLVWAITKAIERRLGKPLDPRELVSLDGTYPTPSVCDLVGCRGCLPDAAYDRAGCLKPEWRHRRPGDRALAPAAASLEKPADPMKSAGKEGR